MSDSSSTQLIGGNRPIRGCDVCGGVDDHPRHVIPSGTPGIVGPPSEDVVIKTAENLAGYDDATRRQVMAAILDTSSEDRHMDCCRSAGCPTGTCSGPLVDSGGEDLRGRELVEHVISLAHPDLSDDELEAAVMGAPIPAREG